MDKDSDIRFIKLSETRKDLKVLNMKFQRTKSNAFLRSTFSIQQGVFITINNVCGKEKILCCEDLPNIEKLTVFGKSLEAESSLSYKQIALRLFCM